MYHSRNSPPGCFCFCPIRSKESDARRTAHWNRNYNNRFRLHYHIKGKTVDKQITPYYNVQQKGGKQYACKF